MRPIEFNSVINRTQMQERDDSRPVVEQQTMSHMENKEVMVKSSQINKNEDAMMNTGYDARREGKGHYEQQDGKRKKTPGDGKVTIKKVTGFDIRI